MSSSPRQEITQTEIAASEIGAQQWQEYLDGQPLREEAYAQMTGRRPDGEGGTEIVEGGMLNPDGSVKINTSASQMATESAATQLSLEQFAAGNVDQAIDDNMELATGEAQDSATKAFTDQSNYLTGLDNVAAMAAGEEAQATSGQIDASITASQNAGQRAQALQQRRAADGQAAGQLAGLGLGAYSDYRNRRNSGVGPKPGHTEY